MDEEDLQVNYLALVSFAHKLAHAALFDSRNWLAPKNLSQKTNSTFLVELKRIWKPNGNNLTMTPEEGETWHC
jgi:hypothetical protein